MNDISLGSQLTVILPTLNESENIGKMISHLHSLLSDLKIIVADDGSTDGTIEIVNQRIIENRNISLLNRSEDPIKGLSVSIAEAINQTETDYFVVLDSDFQHPPEKVIDALKLLNEGFPLVIGYRTEFKGWSFKRRLISWGATDLGKFALFIRGRNRPRDIMSGFFGGKTDFVQKILHENPGIIEPRGYKILFDLLKILPKKDKIGEFPYSFQEREEGKSKIKMKHFLIYFRSLFK
ncbi:MAG: glycosyltransferase [Candidatus Heimdallarchaeota archaeon]|nr:glycosyltransferase [Candidatus Heimdallarchaeota archaeon]